MQVVKTVSAEDEQVVTIDMQHLQVIHREHLHDREWHGDLLRIPHGFVVSHLRVRRGAEEHGQGIIECVLQFVKAARMRCPQGTTRGIMAMVDSNFYSAFEALKFTKVLEYLCISGEKMATMHYIWPGGVTPRKLAELRERSSGAPAMGYCTGCQHEWGADTPACVTSCSRCES